MEEWMEGWMDEWMDGWMEEWMDGWMDWSGLRLGLYECMNKWRNVLMD